MKHLGLTLLFSLAFIAAASSQTDKGTVLLGGSMAYTTTDGNGSFIATPNVGYFVIDNAVVIGKLTTIIQEGSTSWAFGPTVRLYFLESNFGSMFGQLGINVGGGTDSKTQVGWEIGGGYAVFLNESIALEGIVNYTRTGEKGVFALGIGFQIHYAR